MVPKIVKRVSATLSARKGQVKIVDVTTISKAQLRRLVLSDAPQEAPGLRRMVADSRRNTAR
jgi:hypothetical protein